MASRGIKPIAPVPTANDFLDIVLSKTQRKTPTVIHKNFKISRIRNFYMRKVKFTQDSFDEKLEAILTDFPILDNLHPFLSSLLNVLYDKNHYKLALGQLNTAKHLIDQIAKDYVRLLKFGDSLYRCKQLKKAALGRMATVMKRQKDPLLYLEQVRQHISRLPSIDPNTRTLLVCGYPNVGKSSFVNKITRAEVDVQPYAFTTKSLFVGHLDYKYLRWQVVDTPGVLDHPLEEMNTIEMQSITALAHLRCAVLYFMDLSEQCGYTIEAQCNLFHSIKPLFSGKPVILVINKIDVTRLEGLSPENRALVDAIISSEDVKVVQTSCHSEEGVMDVRNVACDALLAHRVEAKLKTNRVDSVANRIHITMPKPRDDKERGAFIPEAVLNRRKYDANDSDRRKLEKDIEAEQGGAGVYSIDMRKNWVLKIDDWKHDPIPEIMDGKNVADFIDPDIAAKLEALEAEEEKLEAAGFYNSDESMTDEDEELERQEISEMKRVKVERSAKKKMKNRPVMPRTAGLLTVGDMTERLTKAGIDPSRIVERAQLIAKARGEQRKRKRDAEEDDEMDVDGEESEGEGDWMDVDGNEGQQATKKRKTEGGKAVSVHGKKAPKTDRTTIGMRDSEQISKAVKLRNLGQRERNRLAKAGEADRVIKTKMPKHLFAGKRKSGKTSRR